MGILLDVLEWCGRNGIDVRINGTRSGRCKMASVTDLRSLGTLSSSFCVDDFPGLEEVVVAHEITVLATQLGRPARIEYSRTQMIQVEPQDGFYVYLRNRKPIERLDLVTQDP